MTLPTHMRRKDGTPVEVVAQGKSFNDTCASVLYLHQNQRGNTSIGYAMADGTNPNHHTPSDLIEYDIAGCASYLQIGLYQSVFTLLHNLWKAGYHDQVVSAAIKDTPLHVTDMRHYLNGLWGN